MRSTATNLVFLILLFGNTCRSADIIAPNSGLGVSLLDGFDLYEIDLGAPLGKSDYIASADDKYSFTFMKFGPETKVGNELILGLVNGLKKQGFKTSEIKVSFPDNQIIVAQKAVLGDETRIYVPISDANTIILAQSPLIDLEVSETFVKFIKSIR